jgi:hypothetical protein
LPSVVVIVWLVPVLLEKRPASVHVVPSSDHENTPVTLVSKPVLVEVIALLSATGLSNVNVTVAGAEVAVAGLSSIMAGVLEGLAAAIAFALPA